MRSEATKHMDAYELQHLQERIAAMDEAELEEYRAGSKSRSRSTNDCVHYFDLERNAWRCFCPENFITIHELP